MRFTKIRSFASILVITLLLVTACASTDDPQAVADEFARLYFVEDNLSEAVKITSGSAKETLETALKEIKALGAKEPAKDEPMVDVTLEEVRSLSQDEMLYVYRVKSTVAVGGMVPLTARLWLRKAGKSWYVSRFIQDE